MDRKTPAAKQPVIEPWPPGWPLPLIAIAPSLRWDDVVACYLTAGASEWGVATEPAGEASDTGEQERTAA